MGEDKSLRWLITLDTTIVAQFQCLPIFRTRFECSFTSSPLVSSVLFSLGFDKAFSITRARPHGSIKSVEIKNLENCPNVGFIKFPENSFFGLAAVTRVNTRVEDLDRAIPHSFRVYFSNLSYSFRVYFSNLSYSFRVYFSSLLPPFRVYFSSVLHSFRV